MNRKVEQALNTMVCPGDHVICAVSGGKDSMAMLFCLAELAPTLGLHISAAHFNHKLRGAESLRDEGFVRELCAKWHIPLDVGSGDVAKFAAEHGLGTEAAARKLRYEFLHHLDPGAKIATAHTAEDNLETVLMHLIRGTTLHGLTGIPPVRENGRIIRPLLTVSRAEIADYLETHSIPHVEDSTNHLDDCLRNRIRHHVLPRLTAENPDLAASVTAMTASLRREDDYLEQTAKTLFHGNTLDISRLLSQHEALQYRVLRQFLEGVPNLTATHLDGALRLCSAVSPSAMLSLPGGYTLARVYGTLELRQDTSHTIPEEIRLRPGEFQFGPWHIVCQFGTVPAVLPKNTLALKSQDALMLRTRRPGDRISLSGGTKKLGRYLIDQKIPAHLRDSLPIVAQENTVLAVLPLRTAKGWQAETGSTGLILTATGTEDEP